MTQKIYRQEALERLSSPDQFDQLMALTNPRGWIALAAAAALLLVAGLWAFLGTITVTVDGEGVLTRAGGIRSVNAPDSGEVRSIDVKPGDRVQPGDSLLRLIGPSGKEQKVVSPVHGRALAFAARAGDRVQKDAPLVTVEPLDTPLEAVVFVPAAEGYQIEPGFRARTSTGAGKGERGASLRGTVKSAARYPASRETIARVLNSDSLADQVTQLGPVLEVVVELEGPRDADKVYSGAPCRAHVIVARKRPISLVLPVFGFLTGARSNG